MVVRTASYPKLTKWKSGVIKICTDSINSIPDSKSLVNPSGTEARRTNFKVYFLHQIKAPIESATTPKLLFLSSDLFAK